jgi:hypothetical protein
MYNSSINLSVVNNPDGGFSISGVLPAGYSFSITSGNVTMQGGATIQNGQLLIGNAAGNSFDQGNLSEGTGVFISNNQGDITINAKASKSLNYFTPTDNYPPISGFATLDTRNNIAVLDFDDTIVESGIFMGVMPEYISNYGSGLSTRIFWSSSAISGNCSWGVAFDRLNNSLNVDSYDINTEASSTVNGVTGVPNITTINSPFIDSITQGDLYKIRLYRNATGVSDTMVGDAELIAVEIRSIL